MTTSQSSDVKAKRASTTDEEAGSSFMKKPRVEEIADENMEDKSESDSERESEIESEEEMDDETFAKLEAEYEAEAKAKAEAQGRVRVNAGCIRFSYVPEPEPEWDVDSYDGRENESDPESRAFFSTENDYQKFRNGRIEALNYRGYVEDPVRYIFPMVYIDEREKPDMLTDREYMTNLASMCVKKFNEEKGKTVEVVSVVRGNVTGESRRKMYITFMAREYPNGPLVEYQAKAMDFIGPRPPFPILCRPAP